MSILENFFTQIKGPTEARRWIFLHGLMGFSANWMKVIFELQKTECCLAYDQRGHGRSFHPEHGFAPEDYASDLKKIVTEIGWNKFILVGHSMGGRNALFFAHQYPEMVEKLIIEDIGPDASPTAHKYYEALLDLVPTPFENREAARLFFKDEFPKKAQARENVETLAQFFYANMINTPDGKVSWRFSRSGIIESVQEARQTDFWKILKELKIPTLLIRGEQSPELSRESYSKILQSNSLIQGVEIPNAGHWVHADQPQLFTDVLKDFVGVGKTSLHQ